MREFARLAEALRDGETIGRSYTVDETKPNAKHALKVDARRTELDPFAIAAIRLLMLTGARLREILHAKWEYVDFDLKKLGGGDQSGGGLAVPRK